MRVAQLRAKPGVDNTITGYAAMFNSQSEDLGGFVEVIRPGAFTKTLANDADIRCLFNHDESLILGRTKSKTLTVTQDEVGLYFECQLPNTTVARDLYESISRGDVDQCSFGFYCNDDNWIPSADGFSLLREVIEADVFDVSAVTYPAYQATSVNARSLFPDGVEGIELRKATALQAIEEKKAQALRDAMSTASAGALIPQGFAPKFEKAKKAIRGEDPFNSVDEANGIINWADGDTEDRSANSPVTNKDKAAKGFAYVANDGSKRSDYMLPHHSVADGQLVHSYAGTKQATADFNSGAVPVPEQFRSDVNQHLSSEASIWDSEDDADIIWDDAEDSDNELNSAAPQGELRKTKKVAGIELPASSFAYVGDEKDTSTWKLPIHFPGDAAKTVNHIKNALARFPDTKGIPASDSSAVWHKIVGAAKAHGIKVNEKKSLDVVVEVRTEEIAETVVTEPVVVVEPVVEVPAETAEAESERMRLQVRARLAMSV